MSTSHRLASVRLAAALVRFARVVAAASLGTGVLAAAWAGPLAGRSPPRRCGQGRGLGYDHSHQAEVPAAAQSGVIMVAEAAITASPQVERERDRLG